MAINPGTQDVAADQGTASGESQRESGGFSLGQKIRNVFGWGESSEPSDETQEQEPKAETATPAAETVTLTRAELEARERKWQGDKDREVSQARAQLERTNAKDQAEAGNLAPIRALAERGDRWALQQLQEQGDTWALGEIKQAELRREAEASGVEAQTWGVASQLDGAYFEPLLAALPGLSEDDKQARRAGAVGLEGRAAFTRDALSTLEKHWRAEGAKDAEEKLRRNPAVLKQVVLGHRLDAEEPDDIQGVGSVSRDSPDARMRAAFSGR